MDLVILTVESVLASRLRRQMVSKSQKRGGSRTGSQVGYVFHSHVDILGGDCGRTGEESERCMEIMVIPCIRTYVGLVHPARTVTSARGYQPTGCCTYVAQDFAGTKTVQDQTSMESEASCTSITRKLSPKTGAALAEQALWATWRGDNQRVEWRLIVVERTPGPTGKPVDGESSSRNQVQVEGRRLDGRKT